jgi:hypothetical protein
MPLQPALLGGLFIGVLSALPVVNLANCCCLWVIGGGMLAAYLDQAPNRAGNIARGALDGLLAGVIGAFVFLMASTVIGTLMAPLQERMIEEMLSGSYDMPPEVRGWFEMMRERDTGFLGHLIGFAFQLIAGLIFGTLGGVLGAVFFWRSDVPPALGGTQPPPPLPPEL